MIYPFPTFEGEPPALTIYDIAHIRHVLRDDYLDLLRLRIDMLRLGDDTSWADTVLQRRGLTINRFRELTS